MSVNKTGLAAIQTVREGEDTSTLGLRDYSPDMVMLMRRRMLTMNDVLRSIGRFDPTRITIHQMEMMRKDTMIQLGLQFKKAPLVNAPWHIECADPQIAAAIDQALRPVYSTLLLRMMNSLDYGFQPIVKRFKLGDWTGMTYEDGKGNEKKLWTTSNVKPLVLDEFRCVPVQGAMPKFQANGTTFDGFQNPTVNVGATDEGLDIPAEYALWVTNMKAEQHEDWFGYPMTGFGLRYWWSYWFRWLLADRHMEQDADPPLVVGYPPDTEVADPTDPTGERKISAQQLAMMIGEGVRNGATIAKPSDTYLDLEQKPTSSLKWTFDFLRGGENMQVFNESFAYLDSMKFASCLMPPSLLNESRANPNNATPNDLGLFYSSHSAVIMEVLDQHINDYIIPDLVAQNFVDAPPVRKVTEPFRKQDLTAASQILTILAQQDPAALDVDVRKFVKLFGIPQISPADRPQAGGNFAGRQGQGTFGNTAGADPNNNPDPNAGTPAANGVQNNPAATPRGGGAPDTGNISVVGFAHEEHTPGQGKSRKHILPDTRTFDDPAIDALAENAYGIINGFLEEVYAGAAKSLHAADDDAANLLELAAGDAGWMPDLHPRWPKGTPGGLGGEFAEIKLTDIAKRLQTQPSHSMNMSFLARGSQHIREIVARPKGDGLRFDVKLDDGRRGNLNVPDTSTDIASVMQHLKDIDDGKHDSTPATNAPAAAPDKAAPVAAAAAVTDAPKHEYTPELQALIEQAKTDPRLAKWPPAKGAKAKRALGPFYNTVDMWTVGRDEHGNRLWAPERRALHEQIKRRWLSGGFTDKSGIEHPPVRAHPGDMQVLYTAGGPASGKSSGAAGLPPDAVIVDADALKAEFPEWDMMQGTRDADGNWIDPPDPALASLTHEESLFLSKEIQKAAVRRGLNLVIDGTGTGTTFRSKAGLLKSKGYTTKIVMTDVPVDEAFARAVARAHRTGRSLSWNMIVGKHEQVARAHLGWRKDKAFDSWELYSNDVPNGADKILIAQGGGGDFQVLEQAAYDAVVSKAGGYHGPNVERPNIPGPRPRPKPAFTIDAEGNPAELRVGETIQTWRGTDRIADVENGLYLIVDVNDPGSWAWATAAELQGGG